MAIAPGAMSKGRTGNAASQATTGVATTAAGSTFVVFIMWGANQTFNTLVDSKSNVYTQIGSEVSTGATSAQYKARLYYKENGVGGAAHTATFSPSGSAAITILFGEITGGLTSGILDQNGGRQDTASPFTLAAALTTTQANELLMSMLAGTSGTNPATHAETGLGSSTVQTAAEELDGTSFWTAALATAVKSATAAFNESWTEAGNTTDGTTFLATFKDITAGGGGGVTVKQLSALGVG